MATAAAAIIIRREKQIVAAFRDAGATTPDKAITMESIGMHHRLAFLKLRNRAILRETTPDHYYVDEPSWEALRTRRRKTVGVMLAVVIVVFVYATYFATHLATKLPIGK